MCTLHTAVVQIKARGNLFVNPTGSVHHQPASCIRTKGESAWYVRWKVQAIQGCQVHNKGWSFSDQNVNFGSTLKQCINQTVLKVWLFCITITQN